MVREPKKCSDPSGGFPERLRRLRECKGMNRKALSECCGLSKNTVARYERGQRTPNIEQAKALADFFEVSLDELCGQKTR